MRKQTIFNGFHRPLSIIPACFKQMKLDRSKPHVWTKDVLFDESCEYLLDNGDQWDWNKLYGWCFGVFGIHENSVRVAWRYNPMIKKIELALYYYKNGKMIVRPMTDVKIGEVVRTSINVYTDKVRVCIESGKCYVQTIDFEDTLLYNIPLFGCGLYFGGNRTAPHRIDVSTADIPNQPSYIVPF